MLISVIHRFTQLTDHSIMGRKRTGIDAICPICQKVYHRPRHNLLHGTQKTCSLACSAVAREGEGNPYFGKTHNEEIRARISSAVRANPPKGTGPKKGVFKHTPEARQKMTEALKERWRTRRADMLSYSKRGMNTPYKDIRSAPRWQVCFTRAQKRDWIGTVCAYCKGTDRLVLDHIIPIICGGINEHCNAQTLCTPCNIWKMRYVDKVLYTAIVGSERG